MSYTVIYDGDCNLCANFVSILEKYDRGRQFCYIALQVQEKLNILNVTPKDCEMGMILLDSANSMSRWQGSEAAEEIVRRLPMGASLIAAYRSLFPLKAMGDAAYIQIRDRRYQLFGKRDRTYHTAYPVGCVSRDDSTHIQN
ncbi:MAG: thiol-disulfide oxidoreductase DCC family protein [Pseudanabaena sp.]